MKKHTFFKSFGRSMVAVLLAFSLSLSLVSPVLAQAPDVVAKMTQEEITVTVKQKIKDALVSALSAELVNLMLVMSSKLAENTAVWVASGGNAESPLFNVTPPADYFKYAGARVISELYNELATEDFKCALTHLCFDSINTPELMFSLRLGLKEMAGLPNPEFDCPNLDWVQNSFPAYLASMRTTILDPAERTAVLLSAASDMFSVEVNQMSALAEFEWHVSSTAYDAAKAEEVSLFENHGFESIKHYITGNVETPASMVEEKTQDDLDAPKEDASRISAALLANSDTLIALGLNAGAVFTNTLLSELLNKYQTGLFEDLAFDTNPFDEFDTTDYSRERVREIFKSLNTFKPLEVTDYSLLSELASCPSITRGSSVGLYNCAIDSSFVSAVALSRAGSTLSLQDAIDEGYIDGGWPLIPSSDTARNQDTKCYTYGFCHSNLVKLRKARIISIGWEMAAESDFNSEGDPVTLQEVIDGFNSCNDDGELDDEHPWCHLIDPNWVLKFPETQCRTLAYGQILSGAGTDQRAEECVDIQSCISEDGSGNCDGGYGYCVREENAWEFRGTACPSYYASCMSFETDEGEVVDYLINTLETGECSSSNAGCYWYSTAKEEVDDVYDWPEVTDVATLDAAANTYQTRIYFNGEVEECDSDDAGCEELYERESDSVLNMIANSGFETDDDEDDAPDAWIISDDASGTVYDTTGDYAHTGAAAVALTDSGEYIERYGLILNQTRYYTLSAYVLSEYGDQGYLTLAFTDQNGDAITMTNQSVTSDCSGEACGLTCTASGDEVEMEVYGDPDEGYTRFECTFTTPTLTDRSLDIYATLTLSAVDVYMDDVMLEQDADASAYTAGYEDSLTSEYLKVAPDYLGCTGSDDDPTECDSYATVCSEQEAGCGEYTPVNGDPSVTAVVSLVDMCPSTCDGYDTYRQEATDYEPFGEFPLYFIPDTADECSESDVGCTEFTNLTTEEREYYTYLRTCVTESQAAENSGDAAATFYTWEGSDEEGYQLKTWRLLESDLDDSGYEDYVYTNSLEVESYPGKAPCTNWVTGEDGITCADDSEPTDGTLDTDTASCDEHTDILVNPDCREFYDITGGIHYRIWEDTVTITDSCETYRITDLAGSDATEQEETCDATDGYYDATANICRFNGYADESTECSSSENGCRAFTGGRSANSRLVLEDLFEGGDITNWEADSASTVTLSNESVAVDGHSLKSEGEDVWSYLYDYSAECEVEDGCDSSTSVLGGNCTVSEGDQYCGTLEDQLYTGKTYTLTFWAKGETDVEVGFDILADDSAIEIDSLVDGSVPTVELTSDWTYYSVGPFDMNEDDYEDFGAGTVLAFVPDSSDDFYIDNIVLREGEDELTLIKDSWETPGECDQSWEGATSAQFHLGCQEYTDQNSETYYLKSFRNLCGEDVVGCTAYYTTEQSDSEYVSVYNATCYNTLDDDGAVEEATEKTGCYVYTNSSRTEFDATSPLLCNIAVGDDSCQYDLEDYFIPESYISDSTNYPELYHLYYGPDTVIVRPDMDAYLIYDENFECSVDVAGCTEVGEPTFSADKSVIEEWESVYYMNEPDDYDSILCVEDALFCRSFESTEEGTWYFKDPLSQTCEYKSDVTINGTSYSGWFREGTTEFCYGTGLCSDDETVSCSADSDCAEVDAGTCDISDGDYLIGGDQSGIWRNGDTDFSGWAGLCSTEYDGCSGFEDPLDIDEDEVYGEDDGEIYYYIDNDQLEDSSLLSSQRCDGQVSQKQGCTLFYDSSDTSLDYNASATYVVSTHADEILGEEQFSLVDPIDCTSASTSEITLPDGSTYDPCATRCVYEKYDVTGQGESGWLSTNSVLMFAVTSDACSTDSDCASDEVCNTYFGYCAQSYEEYGVGFDDIYIQGQSCYTDNDCRSYNSYTGDIISGECVEEALVAYYGGAAENLAYASVDRLENDTNRVISVNQDRVCSEWLSCSSSYSIWDQDAGQYRTICDGIDLCQEYSSEGNASFCSDWDTNDPSTILDADRYVARDVTWYGEEYSGYSIPDVLPIQHLSQVNIAPPVGYCDLSDNYDEDSIFWSYQGTACEVDDEGNDSCPVGSCVTEADDDYRIGFVAGSCEGEYTESCAVGYCTDTGAACTTEEDCLDTDAECVPGVCYTVSETVCEEDADCDSDQECMGGTCVTEGDYCDLETLACDTGETCFTSVAYKEGNCYGGSCFLAMNGDPFEEALYEGQVCRAYPEANSPFDTDVVTNWNYVETSDMSLGKTEDTTDLELSNEDTIGAASPRSYLSGFSSVEACLPGEDCICSYTKLSTRSGEASIYAAPNTDIVDTYSSADDGLLGVCSSASVVAGAACLSDEDCQTDGNELEESATCDRIASENTLYGLEGYCLERDTGLNIEGDADLGACVTWYPVDQIAGATDLYAKYKNAGFFDDTYMCTYVSPYYDLYSENYSGEYDKSSGVACAEVARSCDRDNQEEAAGDCTEYVSCPEGYFAIMGRCGHDRTDIDDGTTFAWNDMAAQACTESGGQNDCPYVCVPEDSVHTEPDEDEEETSCLDDFLARYEGSKIRLSGSNSETDYWGHSTTTSYYFWSYSAFDDGGEYDSDDDPTEYEEFTIMLQDFEDCVSGGIEIDSSDEIEILLEYYGSSNDDPDTTSWAGYRSVDAQNFYDPYPGCQDIVQVADDSGVTAPMTNMFYSGLSGDEPQIDTDPSSLAYILSETAGYFGAAINPAIYNDSDSDGMFQVGPEQIAACADSSDKNAKITPHDSTGEDLCSFDLYQHVDDRLGADPEDPDARSYIDFEFNPSSTSYSLSSIWDVDEDESSVFSRINQLFANPLGLGTVWQWGGDFNDEKSYEETTTSSAGYGDYDLRSEGIPPTVWSVDLDDCGTKYCTEGNEDAITVNGQDSGDQTGDQGFFRATMKFYAAADKNQLPLRVVVVDWGDGHETGEFAEDNYYKNHRGLQDGKDDGEDSLVLSKCSLYTEWGMTTSSCDPNYFLYQHSYTCSNPGSLETCEEDDDGNLTNSPCSIDGETCSFQPRVHVRDNWGWCTGECSGADCFDSYGDLSSQDFYSECSFDYYPLYDDTVDPWVYYDGIITVEE